jgi:hypothetical protein
MLRLIGSIIGASLVTATADARRSKIAERTESRWQVSGTILGAQPL